jgi:predicted DCC family thiol-disulfide oxidoreductase YuxK
MTQALTIYYDGLCHLCSREIEHYRKKAVGLPVTFVDITEPAFDPVAMGFDAKRVHKHLHARLGDRLTIGVDAFLAIWEVIPGHRWLRRIVGCPGIYHLAKLGYMIFAEIRPYLPKRRRAVAECGETCAK